MRVSAGEPDVLFSTFQDTLSSRTLVTRPTIDGLDALSPYDKDRKFSESCPPKFGGRMWFTSATYIQPERAPSTSEDRP